VIGLSFSIGKSYQDELWFDVIPMDGCHLLLGNPWLFDGRVTHNGYLNTYLLTKDGKKITLIPLSPFQLQKAKPKKTKNNLNFLWFVMNLF